MSTTLVSDWNLSYIHKFNNRAVLEYIQTVPNHKVIRIIYNKSKMTYYQGHNNGFIKVKNPLNRKFSNKLKRNIPLFKDVYEKLPYSNYIHKSNI